MPTVGELLDRLRSLVKLHRRTRLDDFIIYGQTAKGSMSKVYRARDPLRNIIVAVKILDPERAATVRKINTLYRDETEGEIAVKLRHPYLVVTYEAGKIKDTEYIIMEFIDGVGLNYLAETDSPRLRGRRLTVMCQVAEGLAYIHSRGYAHRDVCPRNVLLTNDNVPKLIDFGLAVPLRPEFMIPGNRTGTPSYMAPELIRRRVVDHRVDIFAFGVSLYETFTGQLPWPGGDTIAKMVQHLNLPPKDPRSINPKISPELASLILDAMRSDPNQRISTMDEVVERLKALEEKGGSETEL